jgi:hypothetical protein
LAENLDDLKSMRLQIGGILGVAFPSSLVEEHKQQDIALGTVKRCLYNQCNEQKRSS